MKTQKCNTDRQNLKTLWIQIEPARVEVFPQPGKSFPMPESLEIKFQKLTCCRKTQRTRFHCQASGREFFKHADSTY